MTLTEEVAKNIIRKLLKGEDYRIEIVTLIDAEFLQFVVDFFRKVANAKINNEMITADWYKEVFLNPALTKEEIAIHSGLNMKTISNMYNSGTKATVVVASLEHYEALYQAIIALVEAEDDFTFTLTLKLRSVSIELTLNETLIVINTVAVKRAALRGGLWSTAGKRVEKPLMLTLCKLYQVPEAHYKIKTLGKSDESFEREIDFYLCNDGKEYKCEVKLMGKGNPESADAVIARDSSVFIADKLSNTNKAQLDSLKVHWIELRDANGFRRFTNALTALNIPYIDLEPNVNLELDPVFNEIF